MTLSALIIGVHLMAQTKYLNQLATYRAAEVCRTQELNHKGYLKYFPDASTYFGENIAWDFQNEELAFKGWLDSPTHKENLLKKSFTKFGIGRNYCKGQNIIILFLSN